MGVKHVTIVLFFFIIFIEDGFPYEEVENAQSIYDQAREMVKSDLEKSKSLALKAYDVFSSESNITGKIKTLHLLGFISQKGNFFDVAAKNYHKGLDLVKNYNGPEKELYEMSLLQNLGTVYEYTFNYNLALDYYQKALSLALQENFESNISVLFYNLGVVHEKMKSFDKAEAYYFNSLDVTASSNLDHLGSIYNSLGNVYNQTKKFKKAKSFYLQAIEYQKKIENKNRLAYYIGNLGENLFKQGQIVESIKYYKEAVALALMHEDFDKAKFLHNNLGDAYLAQLNNQEAINQYEKAIALCDPEIYDPEYLRALRNIIKAYQQIGAYKKALHYQELQTQAKLLEQKSQYKVKEVELVVENQSSKQKLDSFASEKSHFITIIIGVFMGLNCLLLIAFAYYKGRPILKRVFSSKL